MDPLFHIPEDFASLSDAELQAFIAEAAETVRAIGADPASFVNDGRDRAALLAETQAGVDALAAARDELSARDDDPDDPDPEPEAVADEPVDDADFAALATEADELAAEPEAVAVEPEPEPVAEAEPETPAVTAAAPRRRAPLSAPSRSRQSRPQPERDRVSLVAAGANLGIDVGEEFPSELALAQMMVDRHRRFGNVAPGTEGEKIPIAKADWSHIYGEPRTLGHEFATTQEKIHAVVNPSSIRQAFDARRRELDRAAGDRSKELALVASGGLCAPLTPYYGLEMLSSAERPVRAGLPSFNADRGGIRAARPAALTSVTTGVGYKSMLSDAAGGTNANKTCQRIDCPSFVETDVAAVYHCLEFGNIGQRTFPELVAQWNQLTLAAHARLAETALLNGIDDASTQVTAATQNVGAVSDLFGQILAAAAGMRSRHRMADDTVLRFMAPAWLPALLVSDVIKSQFERFDTDEARVVALLRSFSIEPSFFLDGTDGDSQVFGAQSAAGLLEFPSTTKWFLFPEGSFLYLDGGTLELGLVRDSVLNETNDFQIFGETFEGVAYIGVESLAVTSTICDTGEVAAPVSVACPSY